MPIKLNESFISYILAEQAPSSIANLEPEQLFFCPFVLPLAVLAAAHLTRLAHDLHGSNMADKLTHFLIELFYGKDLEIIVFFECHSDWLPCQIDVDLLKIYGLLDDNLLDLWIIPIL